MDKTRRNLLMAGAVASIYTVYHFTIGNVLENSLPTPSPITSPKKWGAMLKRFKEQQFDLKKDKFYQEYLNKDIETVNSSVNEYVQYTADHPLDVWQTPFETLYLRTGDCEDYSILKMYLLQTGRVLILKSNIKELVDHAVLDINKVILDNRTNILLNYHDLRFYTVDFIGDHLRTA